MPDRGRPFIIEVNLFPQDPKITHVLLSGFLDAHTVIEFERVMGARMADGHSRFIMDMADLNYTSSAGIGALMRLQQNLGAVNGDMVLVSPTDKVLEVLDALDFVKVFKMAESVDEGWALLREDW